jgi:hypothetical protein
VLLASTADKIVALASLLHRARRSGDPAGFFQRRPALLALLGHFTAFMAAGAGRVPASMSLDLAAVLRRLAEATHGTVSQ